MGEMEQMRRRDPDYLKSLLKTRVNQEKMLNSTFCELMVKNPSSPAINALKNELDDLMEEIDNINEDLSKLENGDEINNVTYEFYGGMKELAEEEEKKAIGFYDSIVKHNKASEFIDAEKKKEMPRKTRLVRASDEIRKEQMASNKNFYDSIKENEVNDNSLTKKFINEFRDTADSRIQSNRFLVNLKDALNIPEIMVKSVSFDLGAKMISVSIYDFVAHAEDCADIEDCVRRPIMEVLKYNTSEFCFTIDHLKPNGDIEYVEYYSKCKIDSIYRDPIDYSDNDFSKIHILISYENVKYETTD